METTTYLTYGTFSRLHVELKLILYALKYIETELFLWRLQVLLWSLQAPDRQDDDNYMVMYLA